MNLFKDINFEKVILGSAFMLVTIAIICKFLIKDIADYNMIGWNLGIGSLFVLRKGLSYFKSDSYYMNNSIEIPQQLEEQDKQEKQIPINGGYSDG